MRKMIVCAVIALMSSASAYLNKAPATPNPASMSEVSKWTAEQVANRCGVLAIQSIQKVSPYEKVDAVMLVAKKDTSLKLNQRTVTGQNAIASMGTIQYPFRFSCTLNPTGNPKAFSFEMIRPQQPKAQ